MVKDIAELPRRINEALKLRHLVVPVPCSLISRKTLLPAS